MNLLLLACLALPDTAVLVLVDGVRWQEVFRGPDPALLAPELRAEFGDAERLMPFLWSEVVGSGALLGDKGRGARVEAGNGLKFSYPGYSEMLVGFHDPRIDSNDKRPNPNRTVLQWLHERPGFEKRVAAFGGWDVVPFILDRERCGYLVNAGFEPVGGGSPTLELLDSLKSELPRRWDWGPEDAITFRTALEWLRLHRPRVLYLALAEPDEWAHAGNYPEYLRSLQRTDGFLRALWAELQAQPGEDLLLVSTDHGRGDGALWTDHGAEVEGAEAIWIAALGDGVPALGASVEHQPITQAQIAATLAAALGEDWNTAEPRAAPPIAGLLSR